MARGVEVDAAGAEEPVVALGLLDARHAVGMARAFVGAGFAAAGLCRGVGTELFAFSSQVKN